MQNAIRLSVVLLFLVITIKSQAALPPSTQTVWPSAESLAPNRVSLGLKKIEQLTLSQLQQKLEKIQAALPRHNDNELPTRLLESGHELRELQKISQNRPQLAKTGFNFFLECSQNEELASTLHSVCLSHALRLSDQLELKVKMESYPQNVIRLAKLML